MNYPEPIQSWNLETFPTKKVILYVQAMLSDYPGLVSNLSIEAMHSHQIDSAVLWIKTWCISGRIPTRTEEETVRWPDGWWQMFKNDILPEWFQRRFPVRYAERTITTSTHHYFVCPHLKTDKDRDHIKFMATGTPLAGRI